MQAEDINGSDVEREALVEFNFSRLLDKMWRSRSTLPLFILGSILLALAVFILSTKTYTASLTVAQKQTDSSQFAGGVNGGGSGLLAMALPFLNVSDTNFSTFQYLLTSHRIAEMLYRDPVILAGVYENHYDFQKRQFIEPRGPILWAKALWHAIKGTPAWRAPAPDDLQRYITENVSIDLDKEHNVVQISYDNKDPAFATYFLKSITADADTDLREYVRVSSLHQIDYLNKALNSITTTDTRDSMISMLSDLQKQMMFVETSKYFSFDMVDPSQASVDPTGPSLILYVFASVVLGFCIWVGLAYRFEMTIHKVHLWRRNLQRRHRMGLQPDREGHLP